MLLGGGGQVEEEFKKVAQHLGLFTVCLYGGVGCVSPYDACVPCCLLPAC